MGVLFIEHVAAGDACAYACRCGVDVAPEGALVWEGYMGASVEAYLFRSSVNLEEIDGSRREEALSSGRYELVDVACRACSAALGWRYLAAASAEQKYKENCTLLKRSGLERRAGPAARGGGAARAAAPEAAGLGARRIGSPAAEPLPRPPSAWRPPEEGSDDAEF